MAFNFGFRTVETRRDILGLMDFLRMQPLNYPDYMKWVGKTEAEINMGWKTGVMALSNGHIAGDIIWQPHKEIMDVREIKNLRIHPLLRERGFARFLMKQAEAEGRKSYSEIMLDLREDHPEKIPLINMLSSMGYTKLCTTNLYDSRVRDVVMVKNCLKSFWNQNV